MTAKEIAIAANGRLLYGNGAAVASGVTTDTRGDCADMLFAPIIGVNFDGHDFIDTAFAKGAKVVLTSRGALNADRIPFDAAVVGVDDTLKALGRLAAWHRMRHNALVVGVTGSVGKTTTKDMIALVLSKKYNVLKTSGNMNNEIGLPLTVFGLTEKHTAMVLEMGMNQPGEIARLSKIARPDIAVITNIGDAHIKQFGSKQNILKEKLEILAGLSKNGVVFLNGDDAMLRGLMGLIDRPVVYYGIDEGLDVTGTDARLKSDFALEFEFTWRDRDYGVKLNVAGTHNIHNALAAVAIGLHNGISPKQITDALYEFLPDKLRMNIADIGAVRLINDTYNANPQSVRAAIDVLADQTGGGCGGGDGPTGRRIAVFGDMLELGEFTKLRHREIGEYLWHKGVDILVTVGPNAEEYIIGANGAAERAGGGGEVECRAFPEQSGVAEYVANLLRPGDVILVKGSRSMFMERVAESLERMITI